MLQSCYLADVLPTRGIIPGKKQHLVGKFVAAWQGESSLFGQGGDQKERNNADVTNLSLLTLGTELHCPVPAFHTDSALPRLGWEQIAAAPFWQPYVPKATQQLWSCLVH